MVPNNIERRRQRKGFGQFLSLNLESGIHLDFNDILINNFFFILAKFYSVRWVSQML